MKDTFTRLDYCQYLLVSQINYTLTNFADHSERLLKRVVFHYTPTHASWLNMAEIEIGILDKQCLKGRLASAEQLTTAVGAWQKRRNQQRKTINWSFTRQDADKKLGKHHVA
ncbi:transposase [Phormidesmis sp. 146-33]